MTDPEEIMMEGWVLPRSCSFASLIRSWRVLVKMGAMEPSAKI